MWTRQAKIDYREKIEMAGAKEAWREASRKRLRIGEVMCMCMWLWISESVRKAECTDMDGKTQITTAYWFSPFLHIHTPLLFSVTHEIPSHSSWCHLPLKDIADGRLHASSQKSWWLAERLVLKQYFFIFFSAQIPTIYTQSVSHSTSLSLSISH